MVVPVGNELVNINGITPTGAPSGVTEQTTTQQIANLANISAITKGLLVDPRNYGAKCTGCYGVNPAGAAILGSSNGTGFAIGDKFLLADFTLGGRVRGGVLATGHVTAVDGNGGVRGFVIDTPGSGYFISALWVTPITGNGVAFAINITAIYTPPSAPSTTLASGGNSSGTNNGSYNFGTPYAVGDTFAVPNPAQDGNYMTGRVTGVNGSGHVTSYVINNPGGDYRVLNNVPTITLTGFGTGLTLNITSNTFANNTHDDTYGIINAAIAANAAGGAVMIPDNTWVANLMVPSGTTLMGQGWGVNYAYGDVPNFIHDSTAPHMFIIGTPSFGIDWNGAANVALVGFEVRGYTGSNFGAGTTWDSTAAIGSFNGAGASPKCWLYMMSCKNCYVGLGTTTGTGNAEMFLVSQNSDYGANQNGIWGPFSDFLSFGDTCASCSQYGMFFSATSAGLMRIMFPRIEYCGYGIRLDAGGSQNDIVGAEFDRIVNGALVCNSSDLINVTGGNMKGAGLAGTLTVTNAVSGTGGVIRLTVTGYGNNYNGGASATSGLVTGDKCNVTGVTGTTEANGNQQTITVIDGSHIELQGSTFVNPYVSGGLVGVNTKSSYVVLNGVTDIHFSNVGFYGYSAGQTLAPASVIDSTGSSRISIMGGTANLGNGNTGGYRQAFANWHNSGNTPPVNYTSIINDVISQGTTQATLNGTTAGTVVSSMPFQGASYKKFVAHAAAYENNTAGNQTITFPAAFTNTPTVTANDTGLTVSASTTTLTITAPNNTTTYTGNIFVEGY